MQPAAAMMDDTLSCAGTASEAALAPYAVLDTGPEPAFDDLAQLAGSMCEAPVALINLFGANRQVFKARVGFDDPEPPVEQSLCRHALHGDGLLVIPDLTADPRTRGDAAVANPPYARFYAGAPLRDADGTFLGTICVIDFAARPAGLTPSQARGLRTLAAQVMTALELRRLLHDREAAIETGTAENRRLASSEAHWRGLFEGLHEGFMVGEAIRDDAGRLIDWRHLEANSAFEQVVGVPVADVLGRTIREVAPAIQGGWIDFVGRVLKHGDAYRFDRPVRRAGRSYDGRLFPIGGDQFAAIFLDVTERIAAQQRQAALLEIGDRLRDLDQVEDMTRSVAAIVGRTLDAARAGFGRLDEHQQTILMEPGWMASGVEDIAGLHRFADYGRLLDELLVGEPLVIDDVTRDERTASDPAPMQGLNIGALVNMPVRERGRTVAVYYVHVTGPRAWTGDELSFLREVADRMEAAIERVEREARRILQTQELSHRVKNTLAMVQAIASQTLKPIAERAAVDTFERRLTALATAHDILLGNEWEPAPLEAVIRSVLDSAGQDDRVQLTGPRVELSPRAVLSASLLVHELATNAVKYGALSTFGGMVLVDWTVRNRDGRPHIYLEWTERGGPPAAAPTRRGFGSRLINMGLAGTGGVDLDYSPLGLTARMTARVDDLTKS